MSITAAIGFLGGALPTMFDMFKNGQDNKQELKVMEIQAAVALKAEDKRFDMNVLTGVNEGFIAALEHDNKAGEYKSTTYVGRFLFDLVAVWRSLMRPLIVTVLLAYYGWVKYQIIEKALPSIVDWSVIELSSLGIWTMHDMALLELGISFYLGKRSFEKMAGHR